MPGEEASSGAAFREWITRHMDLGSALDRDEIEALAMLRQSTQRRDGDRVQFWRRTTVRAIFARIEGSMALCIDMLGWLAHIRSINASPEHAAALNGRMGYIAENGEVRTQPPKMTMVTSTRFLVRMLNHYIAPHPDPHCQAPMWIQFKQAIGLRDRLVHPKLPLGMEVSEAEMTNAVMVSEWHRATTETFLWDHFKEQIAKRPPGSPRS